jgi:hypothetical protein
MCCVWLLRVSSSVLYESPLIIEMRRNFLNNKKKIRGTTALGEQTWCCLEAGSTGRLRVSPRGGIERIFIMCLHARRETYLDV